MVFSILGWGLLAGIAHFILIGILYGNPFVDRIYSEATKTSPAVRKWASKPKYLLTQFLGTQVEVFILTAAFFLIRPLMNELNAWAAVMVLATMVAGIRIYPRFWNMWIQTNYPRRLLAIEAINGTIGTFAIMLFLEAIHK